MLKKPILVVDHAPYGETLAPSLEALGHRVVSARSGVDGLREFESLRPPWVIVNTATHGASELVDSIRLRDTTAQILVTTLHRVETVITEYRGRADEFLSLPVAPVVLEVTLQRMEQTVRLQRRIRSISENLESRARGSMREIVDTERFLAVRQIVEKMSIFIGQVARSAQGGCPILSPFTTGTARCWRPTASTCATWATGSTRTVGASTSVAAVPPTPAPWAVR